MNPSQFVLAGLLTLASPSILLAQVTIEAAFVSSFGAGQTAEEISVATARDADPFQQFLAGLTVDYRYRFSTSLGQLRHQPHLAPEPIGSEPALHGTSRIALDRGSTEGPFRPFMNLAIGRLYGDAVADHWTAGLGGGARVFLQPRTFLRASVEYGWEFSQWRAINERLMEGQWSWSMSLGFTF
jgi:hypothetical protein